MWLSIDSAPEGRLVMTKVHDTDGVRNEQPMCLRSNLWFVSEMYVYYRPTHWRDLTEVERMKIKDEAERNSNHNLDRVYKELGL